MGEEFGSKEPVYLPNYITRRISVAVSEIDFADGSVWTGSNEEWEAIPIPEAIVERFSDEELIKQYELEVGGNCAFVPTIRKGAFQCTCGKVNLAGAGSCYHCGRSFDEQVTKLDMDYLTARRDERLQKEAEEREAAEKAAAEAAVLAAENKKRKTKKTLMIALPIIVAIILAALAKYVFIPNYGSFVDTDSDAVRPATWIDLS